MTADLSPELAAATRLMHGDYKPGLDGRKRREVDVQLVAGAFLLLDVRAGLLEAVAEAADRLVRLHSDFLGLPVLADESFDAAVEAWADLRAALVAAGATGKAGT